MPHLAFLGLSPRPQCAHPGVTEFLVYARGRSLGRTATAVILLFPSRGCHRESGGGAAGTGYAKGLSGFTDVSFSSAQALPGGALDRVVLELLAPQRLSDGGCGGGTAGAGVFSGHHPLALLLFFADSSHAVDPVDQLLLNQSVPNVTSHLPGAGMLVAPARRRVASRGVAVPGGAEAAGVALDPGPAGATIRPYRPAVGLPPQCRWRRVTRDRWVRNPSLISECWSPIGSGDECTAWGTGEAYGAGAVSGWTGRCKRGGPPIVPAVAGGGAREPYSLVPEAH